MYQVTVDYAKSHLDELCDHAIMEPKGIAITRGDQKYILVNQEEWESLMETATWMQDADILSDVAAARQDYQGKEALTMEQVFGISLD
jgi:PHD/YefM family antitoxin component YafN of YafNO toxin-antitoxin module